MYLRGTCWKGSHLMGYLYITEHGAKISFTSNCVKIQYPEGQYKNIPVETLENISIFCNAQVTTQCLVECMKRGITVSYYSSGGRYYGRLETLEHVHTERQRRQVGLYNSDFALEFGKKTLRAKIKNQEVLLRRYARNKDCDITDEIKMMDNFYRKMKESDSITQMMGYEGGAAKSYFHGLSKVTDDKFQFNGRSKRPPEDEFNAMLSLGYSIIMNEIYGIIAEKGLNPYFGFVHRDKEKHPSLASDLMEEWRPVIVDSVVMSLVNGHEILLEHFTHDEDGPGFFLTKEGKKIFIDKLEKKERTEITYLSYITYPVTFKKSMELQVNSLVHAIEEENIDIYQPVRIR